MSSEFESYFYIDEDSKLILMTVVGEIESGPYIDRQIRFLSGIAKPWAYDYITNLEQSTGFVAFEEAKRYAAFWGAMQYQIDRIIRQAVVTQNPLVTARLPMANLLFPKHNMAAFASMEAAEAWLSSPAEAPNPIVTQLPSGW